MRFIRLASIFTLLITLSTMTFGQDLQKSTEKVRIDGAIYYVHNVKKGETIYSLTKAYNISEDELLRTNPALAEGLKEGQLLRIPENLAQANVKPAEPTSANGMVAHEVQRKETLYSISRQYNVSVNDLKRVNPTIDENIKKGQIIYIPIAVSTQQQNTAQHSPAVAVRYEDENSDMSGEHIYHSVTKGETLYTIARQYNTDESIVRQLNTDAFRNNELLEGSVLRIPKYNTDNFAKATDGSKLLFPGYSYQPESRPVPVNTYSYRNTDVFNIAFLIPFSKSTIDGSIIPETSSSSTGKKQNHYLNFYEGALLAIDSLKKSGLSLNISTFDVSDVRSLNTALQDRAVEQAQLIIAPVQTELTQQLADYAQRRQIPVVLPTSMIADSILAYNPYIVELRPSTAAINSKLLEDICRPDNEIILVNYAGSDTTLLHSYSNIIKAKGCRFSTVSYEISRSRSTLISRLSPTKQNHVIVASATNQSFVMDVIEALNVAKTKNKIPSTLYGSSEWRKMGSINTMQVNHLYNLNLHTAQPFFVDYNDKYTQDFILKYRYYYKGEPTNYSFYGYDVSFYFLSCLQAYGANFMQYLPTYKESLLQSRFQFHQVGYGGMRNEGVFLLEYQPTLDISRK